VKYTITPDVAIVPIDGKPVFVPATDERYQALVGHLLAKRFAEATALLATPDKLLRTWDARFTLTPLGEIVLNGETLPALFTGRVLEMAKNGEDPAPIFAFAARLAKNPSANSRAQLFRFLQHKHLAITPEGFVLAYKAVRQDYLDWYSATYKNTPGTTLSMPREAVDPDPAMHCSAGFHVGTLDYARNFRSSGYSIILICRVDPADVVSVPDDCDCQKMRVCSYYVVGHYGAELSSTTSSEDSEVETDAVDMPSPDAAQTAALAPASTVPFTIPQRWLRMASMDTRDLMLLSMETLRLLAMRGFRIVGAARIPGGKGGLVAAINRVRGC
jgi:hypothetical protein